MKLKYKKKRGLEIAKSGSDDMPSCTSTPLKTKDRKSVSLLDISDIDSLQKKKFNASLETLGSTSSICKDSGYNHSESSLASEKANVCDESAIDFQLEYFRLLDDLKFKDVLISSLHESNHNLRMKIAEAENKISELRLKSQAHCQCCNSKPIDNSLEVQSTSSSVSLLKYTVSTFAQSEPCLLISTRPKVERAPKVSPPTTPEEHALPNADSFSKVTEWQHSIENLKDIHKKQITYPNTNTLSPVSTLHKPLSESNRVSTRPLPESIPKNLSYMETSRALAETYRRRPDQGTDLFSFQVVDDQSISVTPVHLVQRDTTNYDNFVSGCCDSQCEPKTETSKDLPGFIPEKQGILKKLLIRNQAYSSSNLLDCLREAMEDSELLSSGLSRLPRHLDSIRSLSNQK